MFDTIDELQVIVRAFVCAIFIKFLSLLDSRRKYNISKNLDCPLVRIDKCSIILTQQLTTCDPVWHAQWS